MTGHDDSYIAWDGSRYRGMPPAGWYLAADNRWWPSQELIDSGGRTTDPGRPGVAGQRAVGGTSDAPGTSSATDVSGASSAHRSPPRAPPTIPPSPPSPPPAPSLTGGNIAVAGVPASVLPPTTTSAPPPARRRRRRNKVGPGFIIPLVVFLLFRCGAGSSSTVFPDSDPRPLPTVPPTTTFETFDAVEDAVETIPPTTAVAPSIGPPAIEVDGLDVRPTGCGPGTFNANVTNLGPITRSFDVTVEIVQELGGGLINSFSVDRTIGPLDPGEAEPLIVPLDGALADAQQCQLRRILPRN